MNTRPATLAAAGTVLLWASAFPAITVAVRGLGPAGLAVARLAVASAALALAAPLMGVRPPKLGDLPLIALCGLAGMTGYQLLLNAGERVVPAGTASLLVATAPVYASLLAVAFLGERPGRRRWAGSAVALAGTAVIAVAHGLGFGASALIVLAAAVLQAVFHTAQKPLLARYKSFEVTVYAMWAGTVFILPWTGALVRALPGAGGGAIGSAVFLGVAPSAAGVLLAGGSGVAAGDEDGGRDQGSGRPGQHDQQGQARGEQVRRRVQRRHLAGRLKQREPADQAVPRGRQQAQDGRHHDHRDRGGDAARGVPDDRAEGQAEQRAYAQQQAGRQHRPGHPGPGQDTPW